MIEVSNLSKSFTLHTQGGTVIEVMRDAALTVTPGECVALTGVSGAGKSTLMRMIWGNYRADSGVIRVGGTDLAGAEPRVVLCVHRGSGPLRCVRRWRRRVGPRLRI